MVFDIIITALVAGSLVLDIWWIRHSMAAAKVKVAIDNTEATIQRFEAKAAADGRAVAGETKRLINTLRGL